VKLDDSVTLGSPGERRGVVALSRRVRFSIPFSRETDGSGDAHNTFAGFPSLAGLGAFYEIDVCCRGTVDEPTGWLVDIGTIDRSVRRVAIPLIRRATRERPDIEPGRLLPEIMGGLGQAVGAPIHSLTWRLTPFYNVSMESASMDHVLIRQRFSFAASHRLHSPALDEAENRRVYGKCNNPHGHGHNYAIDVAAAVRLAGAGEAPGFGLLDLERVVDEAIVERFDHTHLNLDTDEFAALIPSVEHIAKVCYDLLDEPIRAAGARLEHVTVWETEKTSCTYPVKGA
jgi:6-pyruvoyltetrahydropterin/6-carboxytetrahydropterin synthase